MAEQKRTREALEESEERYRALFECSGTAVAVLDTTGKFVDVNKKLLSIIGCKRSEVVGERFGRFVPKREAARLIPMFADFVRGKRPPATAYEFPFLRKDGEKRIALLESAYLRERGIILISFTDITKRKKGEQELREAYEKMKTLDELKTDFVQAMSHELRTPITSMKLAAELLGRDLSAEEELEVKDMVVRNTARLDSIVNTILNFSVMESGKVRYKRGKLDLNSVVSSAVEGVRERAKAGGLRVRVRLGRVPPVRGDAVWLGVVMDNLLDNAIKFTRKGGVTVATKRGGKRAVVRVSDTGAGVKKKDAGKAFHKFVKMQPHVEGTGVGLWTCKQIVEAHGGEIILKSKGPGKGTTIEFWLPAK